MTINNTFGSDYLDQWNTYYNEWQGDIAQQNEYENNLSISESAYAGMLSDISTLLEAAKAAKQNGGSGWQDTDQAFQIASSVLMPAASDVQGNETAIVAGESNLLTDYQNMSSLAQNVMNSAMKWPTNSDTQNIVDDIKQSDNEGAPTWTNDWFNLETSVFASDPSIEGDLEAFNAALQFLSGQTTADGSNISEDIWTNSSTLSGIESQAGTILDLFTGTSLNGTSITYGGKTDNIYLEFANLYSDWKFEGHGYVDYNDNSTDMQNLGNGVVPGSYQVSQQITQGYSDFSTLNTSISSRSQSVYTEVQTMAQYYNQDVNYGSSMMQNRNDFVNQMVKAQTNNS